jgi:transcriptional regulator with XRE-family HTH domain
VSAFNATRLASFMRYRRYTVAHFAQLTGYSVGTVVAVVEGKQQPSEAFVSIAATVLQVREEVLTD